MLRISKPFQLALAFVLILVVTACGSDGGDDPTPTPTTAPGPTAGELADRIAVAWSGVTTFRTVSGNLKSGGTPPAGPAGVQVVTEVILPDRKHQVSTSNGETVSEFILIGNDVYVRRPATETEKAKTVQWLLADPSTLDPGSVDGAQVAGLLAPIQPPYAGLSQDERGRTAKPLGEIDVNGQACSAYQIADTTQTGERVDVTLALNAEDLPCSIQTKVSGVDYLTTFEFNIPLSIEPPVIRLSLFQ